MIKPVHTIDNLRAAIKKEIDNVTGQLVGWREYPPQNEAKFFEVYNRITVLVFAQRNDDFLQRFQNHPKIDVENIIRAASDYLAMHHVPGYTTAGIARCVQNPEDACVACMAAAMLAHRFSDAETQITPETMLEAFGASEQAISLSQSAQVQKVMNQVLADFEGMPDDGKSRPAEVVWALAQKVQAIINHKAREADQEIA